MAKYYVRYPKNKLIEGKNLILFSELREALPKISLNDEISRKEKQHNVYHNIFKPLIIITASQLWSSFPLSWKFLLKPSTLTHPNHKASEQCCCSWGRCPYKCQLPADQWFPWSEPMFKSTYCNMLLLCLCLFPARTDHHVHDLLTSFLKVDMCSHILPKISSSKFLILIRLFILIERPNSPLKQCLPNFNVHIHHWGIYFMNAALVQSV